MHKEELYQKVAEVDGYCSKGRAEEKMNSFVNITSIELSRSKEEVILEKEIENLLFLVKKKEQEKRKLTTKRVNDFLSKNVTGFHLGEIIYNVNTGDKFVVDNLKPLNISII